MIIDSVIDRDLEQISEVLNNNDEFKQLEARVNALIKELEKPLKYEMEDVVLQYVSLSMRLSYLAGFKDFYELFITLDKNLDVIMQEYIEIL